MCLLLSEFPDLRSWNIAFITLKNSLSMARSISSEKRLINFHALLNDVPPLKTKCAAISILKWYWAYGLPTSLFSTAKGVIPNSVAMALKMASLFFLVYGIKSGFAIVQSFFMIFWIHTVPERCRPYRCRSFQQVFFPQQFNNLFSLLLQFACRFPVLLMPVLPGGLFSFGQQVFGVVFLKFIVRLPNFIIRGEPSVSNTIFVGTWVLSPRAFKA